MAKFGSHTRARAAPHRRAMLTSAFLEEQEDDEMGSMDEGDGEGTEEGSGGEEEGARGRRPLGEEEEVRGAALVAGAGEVAFG